MLPNNFFPDSVKALFLKMKDSFSVARLSFSKSRFSKNRISEYLLYIGVAVNRISFIEYDC